MDEFYLTMVAQKGLFDIPPIFHYDHANQRFNFNIHVMGLP